jgi:broad specificity phosphatase PhoE
MKLYLIRHGKTVEAGEGMSQSPEAEVNINLVDKSIVKNLNQEKVFSSPLPRSTKTAEILFGEYEVVDYIYEYIRPKILDGKSRDEARKFWDWGLVEYRKNPDWKYEGSESFNEIKSRATNFLNFLKKQKDKYKSVVVVGHTIFFRHLLGVIASGDKYDQKIYLDLGRYIDWDNLDTKEIEI